MLSLTLGVVTCQTPEASFVPGPAVGVLPDTGRDAVAVRGVIAGPAAGRVDGAAFGFRLRLKPPPPAAVAVAVPDPSNSSAATPMANRRRTGLLLDVPGKTFPC